VSYTDELTFYVEQLDPELADELEAVRVAYVERKGRPGYRLFGCLYSDLDKAVAHARVLHEEGHRISVYVRFLR
jgi:hypothetical protein